MDYAPWKKNLSKIYYSYQHNYNYIFEKSVLEKYNKDILKMKIISELYVDEETWIYYSSITLTSFASKCSIIMQRVLIWQC